MSLIFKALQRFQKTGMQPEDLSVESSVQRKGYSFRKVFLSPAFLLGMTAAVCLTGFVAFQGMRSLHSNGQQLTPVAEAAFTGDATPKQNDSADHEAMVDMPEPDLAPQQASQPNQTISYQVHQPEEPPSGAIAESASSNTDQVRLNTLYRPSSQARQPAGQIDTLPAGSAVGEQMAVSQEIGQSAYFSPTSLKTWPPEVIQERKKAKVPSAQIYAQQKQQIRASRATQHLKISRLVSAIHSAIQNDDTKRASRLLKELVQIKGAKHPFVYKLKAYSYIRQDRLDEAKVLLSRVLSENRDDLEAGLNMAVIEIKSGKYAQARQRLVRLQGMYPEQDHVALYLKQLPP